MPSRGEARELTHAYIKFSIWMVYAYGYTKMIPSDTTIKHVTRNAATVTSVISQGSIITYLCPSTGNAIQHTRSHLSSTA